jgi:hypothetical protein
VAVALGGEGLVTGAGGSFSVWVVASVVFVVGFVLKSMQSAVCMVWEAVSVVLGGVGVVWMSTPVVVTSSVWASSSSTKTAPRKSALAWATIERQSPAPCPSVSHFFRSSSFPCCVPSSCPSSSPFLRAVSSFSRPSFFPAS